MANFLAFKRKIDPFKRKIDPPGYLLSPFYPLLEYTFSKGFIKKANKKRGMINQINQHFRIKYEVPDYSVFRIHQQDLLTAALIVFK